MKSITEQWIAERPERCTFDGRRLLNYQNCRQEVANPCNGLPVHSIAAAIRERNQQFQEAETIRRQITLMHLEAVADDHAAPNRQVDLVVDRQPNHDSPRQQPTRLPTRGITNYRKRSIMYYLCT